MTEQRLGNQAIGCCNSEGQIATVRSIKKRQGIITRGGFALAPPCGGVIASLQPASQSASPQKFRKYREHDPSRNGYREQRNDCDNQSSISTEDNQPGGVRIPWIHIAIRTV
jgi:hypothetical protein